MDQLVFSTTFANQPYDLVAHQQTSTSNKNATLEQDTRPVGNSNPATPASAETTRIPESIPLLDETLARDLHFALRTARGVEIPGFGTIRVDHFEGAFTVPKPRAVPKEPKDPQTLAMAGELCDLFIGRVPYGYARDMGAMLERAVGCEVFGCSPLPNLKNPKQPATSCSLSVRLCDAWAFEALHKRCIVTEDGLLVVPPEAAEEFESILQFRDMMLQQHLGSTRKGGQALVIEKRALSQKAKPDVLKPVSEIKEYKPAAGHNIAAREFKPMQDTRGGIGANEQAPFKPSSGFRDFKLSADSREFTPHQMSTTSLQEAKPTPSKPILIAPHPICHGFYL